MRTAVVRAAILGAVLCLSLAPGFGHAEAPAHGPQSARGLIIPPGVFLKDVEVPRWQRDWYAAVQAKDCGAVQRHLAEGKAAGDPAGKGLEGVMLRDGICRQQDTEAASAHFLAAIGEREVAPMIGLGWLHLERNKDQALRWFQKAFLTWGPLAPWQRWAEFMKSGLYFPANGELLAWVGEEFKRIDDLAVQGADVMLAVAEKIEAGDAFVADAQSACLWRHSAAKGTSSQARMALAQQLHEGRGVPRRMYLAANWYYKAALDGNATAMTRLGMMLIEGGEGLKGDPRGALKALVRAEALGMDTGAAIRAASAKLGDQRAEAIRRTAKEGPLPVPRIEAGTPGVECW